MIVQRLVVLFFLFILIDAKPIRHNIRRFENHQRRSLDITDWQHVDKLSKHLFENHIDRVDLTRRMKRSETPLELRPVGGPINIEQLPAMLAARHVKRYPFSQQDDPAIIGR